MKIKSERQAWQILRIFLEDLGWAVIGKYKKKAGPDLVASRDCEAIRVEIKLAYKNQRKSWRVNPVEKNRKEDDYICVVYPSGFFTVYPMEDHLKLCSKCGMRVLTKQAKLLGEI